MKQQSLLLSRVRTAETPVFNCSSGSVSNTEGLSFSPVIKRTVFFFFFLSIALLKVTMCFMASLSCCKGDSVSSRDFELLQGCGWCCL